MTLAQAQELPVRIAEPGAERRTDPGHVVRWLAAFDDGELRDFVGQLHRIQDGLAAADDEA